MSFNYKNKKARTSANVFTFCKNTDGKIAYQQLQYKSVAVQTEIFRYFSIFVGGKLNFFPNWNEVPALEEFAAKISESS